MRYLVLEYSWLHWLNGTFGIETSNRTAELVPFSIIAPQPVTIMLAPLGTKLLAAGKPIGFALAIVTGEASLIRAISLSNCSVTLNLQPVWRIILAGFMIWPPLFLFVVPARTVRPLLIVLLSTQWAAVSTHWLLISDPPQKWPPLNCSETCQGCFDMSVVWPPTIRPSIGGLRWVSSPAKKLKYVGVSVEHHKFVNWKWFYRLWVEKLINSDILIHKNYF